MLAKLHAMVIVICIHYELFNVLSVRPIIHELRHPTTWTQTSQLSTLMFDAKLSTVICIEETKVSLAPDHTEGKP